MRIELLLVYIPRDHTSKNAQNGLEMLIKGAQRGNGATEGDEILRGTSVWVDKCACEFG